MLLLFICEKESRLQARNPVEKWGETMQNRIVFRVEKTAKSGLICCFALATCKKKSRHKAVIFAYDWKGTA